MKLAVWIVLIGGAAGAAPRGILLEDLTWPEAEKALRPETVVVIPIGAESKEHGPHLKLKNDWLMAEYFKARVLERTDVVVAPTVNYHFYPAFVEYPGSTTLRLETARDLMVDICRSLARYGPKKFYALNTGVSTMRALTPAVEILAKEGITLRFTNILTIWGRHARHARKRGKTRAGHGGRNCIGNRAIKKTVNGRKFHTHSRVDAYLDPVSC